MQVKLVAFLPNQAIKNDKIEESILKENQITSPERSPPTLPKSN